ncbi:MAG: hypothetical protein ABSF77_11300 [Spirochaetia bacterium]
MSGIHADSARSLVRQLVDTGERLPKKLRRDVLHLGDAGVTALLEILEDETLTQIDSPGKGWTPIHAAGLHPLRATLRSTVIRARFSLCLTPSTHSSSTRAARTP